MPRNRIQNIIKNRILTSLNGNYQIKDNYIIKMPIKDIVVGFFLERSSTENLFYVWWFSLPLYIPNDMFHLTYGNRIKLDGGSQLWDFSDSHLGGTMTNLLPKLLTQKKTLEFLETPTNFYDYYFDGREKNIHIYEAVVCSGYWVGISKINIEIENCLNFINNKLDLSVPWIKKISDDLILLQSKKSKNQALDLLRQWRENSLFKLNLIEYLS